MRLLELRCQLPPLPIALLLAALLLLPGFVAHAAAASPERRAADGTRCYGTLEACTVDTKMCSGKGRCVTVQPALVGGMKPVDGDCFRCACTNGAAGPECTLTDLQPATFLILGAVLTVGLSLLGVFALIGPGGALAICVPPSAAAPPTASSMPYM